MAFFDKKEDVLDIKLTQYGKIMLQKGRFRPHYYCFYDDNVLYDSKYEHSSSEIPSSYAEENQSGITDRIRDVQRLKTQHIFYGAESSVDERNQEYDHGRSYYDPRYGEIRIKTIDTFYEDFDISPNPEERDRTLGYKIYDGPLSTRSVPTLEVKSNFGHFVTGSFSHLTQSISGLPIPQIKANPVTKLSQHAATNLVAELAPGTEEYRSMRRRLRKQSLLSNKIRLADREIKIEAADLYLEFNEQNSFYMEENYDLEVFFVRKRATDQGASSMAAFYLNLDGDDNPILPSVDQYMIFTGSDNFTKAAFVVKEDPPDHGAQAGYFDAPDSLVPIYKVRRGNTEQEFFDNFGAAIQGHDKDGLREKYISDFLVAAPLSARDFRDPVRGLYLLLFNKPPQRPEANTNIVSTMNGNWFTHTWRDDHPFEEGKLAGGRTPTFNDYLVPLNFHQGGELMDRFTFEHNFDLKKDNEIPRSYPKYFDMHTKMSIFARRQERDEFRPSALEDIYEGNSFDDSIEECDEEENSD